MSDGDAEADEETCSGEHSKVGPNRLQNPTENHDQATDNDSRASTENVGNVGDNWESNDGSNRHDSIEKPTLTCGGVVKCWAYHLVDVAPPSK